MTDYDTLEEALNDVESLREKLPSLGTWLAAPMLVALMAGMASEQVDAAQAGGAVTQAINAISPDALGELGGEISQVFNLPPDEAISWMRAKGVVSPEIYQALDAAARSRAFSIAGLTNDYALESIRDSITKALDEGITVNDWLDRTAQMFTRAGLGAQGDLPLHHLKLVFRQNTYSAYSAGRYTQMRRSVEARPYWMYVTVGDENVRPEHAALDGTVKPADDPFWDWYYPPWDYGCRCTVVSLDAEELAEMGLAGPTSDEEIAERYGSLQPSMGPQLPPVREGFGGNPAERFFAEGVGATAEGREAYEALMG